MYPRIANIATKKLDRSAVLSLVYTNHSSV